MPPHAQLGDPCCTWTFASGKPPLFTMNISNPGNVLSLSTRAPYNCTAAAEAEAAPAARLPGAVAKE